MEGDVQASSAGSRNLNLWILPVAVFQNLAARMDRKMLADLARQRFSR